MWKSGFHDNQKEELNIYLVLNHMVIFKIYLSFNKISTFQIVHTQIQIGTSENICLNNIPGVIIGPDARVTLLFLHSAI